MIKYLGVAYLVYLAWATWRDKGALAIDTDQQARPARQVIFTAITINLLNPKLTIFFFAFLPQFVPAGNPHSLQHMLALSVVFVVMTFAVFAVYGLLAAATRERFLRNPRCADPTPQGLRRVRSWCSAAGWRSSPASLGPCRPWVTSPICSSSGSRRTTPTAGTRSAWCAATPRPTYAGSCWPSTR